MLRSLVRDGLVHVLASNALMQVVGFVVLLALPRLVEPEVFGEIRVLQSILDLLVIAGGFGFSTALLTHATAPGPDHAQFPLLRAAAARTLFASGAVVTLVVLASVLGLYPETMTTGSWLAWLSLSVPFLAVSQLLVSFLHARARLPDMAKAQGLVKLQSAVLILLAACAFGLIGFVAASVAAAAVSAAVLVRSTGTGFLRTPPTPLGPGFVRTALHSVTANALQIAGRYADLFVVGLFVPDAAQIAPYALATVLTLPVFVFSSSVQAACIPRFAKSLGDRPGLSRAVVRLQIETVGAAAVLALFTWLVAPSLVGLVYDASYAAALPWLRILLFHAVLRSAGSIWAGAHIAIGRTGLNVAASAVSALLGLALGALGLWKFGLSGVAWAQVATSAVLALLYPVLFAGTIRSSGKP